MKFSDNAEPITDFEDWRGLIKPNTAEFRNVCLVYDEECDLEAGLTPLQKRIWDTYPKILFRMQTNGDSSEKNFDRWEADELGLEKAFFIKDYDMGYFIGDVREVFQKLEVPEWLAESFLEAYDEKIEELKGKRENGRSV